MLFRVSGKFADGRTLSIRQEAVSALEAISKTVAGIVAAKGDVNAVREIRAYAMGAKSDAAVHIGAPRAPRVKKNKAGTPAATARK